MYTFKKTLSSLNFRNILIFKKTCNSKNLFLGVALIKLLNMMRSSLAFSSVFFKHTFHHIYVYFNNTKYKSMINLDDFYNFATPPLNFAFCSCDFFSIAFFASTNPLLRCTDPPSIVKRVAVIQPPASVHM